MRYAPIIAFDWDNHKWITIGVLVNSRHGAKLKVDPRRRIVHDTPSYRRMEEVYNREFQEGYVSFYGEIGPNQMSSPIIKLETTADDFIERYRQELRKMSKAVQLGPVQLAPGQDIESEMDNLLREVMSPDAVSSS